MYAVNNLETKTLKITEVSAKLSKKKKSSMRKSIDEENVTVEILRYQLETFTTFHVII